MNISKKENNSISFWRIIFTLLIVMLHCGYTQGGYIGVEFFFLVSGFLLANTGFLFTRIFGTTLFYRFIRQISC